MESKKELLNQLSTATNRSYWQTLFLYNLLDGDFLKLVELEEKLMNNHVNYCPGDMESVEEVLKMKNGDFFKVTLTYKFKK